MSLLKAGIVGAVLSGFAVFLLSQTIFSTKEIPNFSEVWWKPGNEKIVDQQIRPFNITFSSKLIVDLKARLNNTRNTQPSLTNAGNGYGVSIYYMPQIIDHWLNKYDFKKQEKLLNRYPQYITNIQGLNIHYVHVKPNNTEEKRVLPLLLMHSWPGSFLEFYKIIPYLTNPREDQDFVFELVIPSYPGFAFSDAPTISGLSHIHIAIIFKNLMLRLGFSQFYVQGGDWGSFISNVMSAMFPQNVLGLHSNMCFSMMPYTMFKSYLFSIFPSLIVSKEKSHLMYPLNRHVMKKIEQGGYLHVQATKPDTFGVALTDSPAGLAAWILEKFAVATSYDDEHEWKSGLLKKFGIDELIDNIMMYWSSNSIISSMRLYAESANYYVMFELMPQRWFNKVPSACAQFPNEIIYQPESLLRDYYVNLVRLTQMPRGGHFAAMEEPKLLADDIWESIKLMESLRREET